MNSGYLKPVAWMLALASACLPFHANSKPNHQIDSSVLGMPAAPWPYVRQGPQGLETYLIPSQLDALRHLPEPERSTSLRTVREHEANLNFLRKTSHRFFRLADSVDLHAVPEYTLNLAEVVVAVDFDNIHPDNPLYLHEPLLKALPQDTHIILLAPAAVVPKVRERLHALGIGERVRLVVSQDASKQHPSEGVTRWVRDVLLVGREGKHPILLASLSHKNFADVYHNDLAYLSHIADAKHQVVRMPIFLRGGNLTIARANRTVLLVGEEEMKMNQAWFVEAFGFSPPPNAVPAILKAATGVDEVVILPNSRDFYHLDMLIAPLADGAIGLAAPEDPQNLPPVDRDVLVRTRDVLQRLGFHIVPVPTSADRIRHFESPVNIVTFTDRHSRRHRALVPIFPEPGGQPTEQSLNAKALAAYRGAGIDPIPVEDRFHLRWGNTHCALVPLN